MYPLQSWRVFRAAKVFAGVLGVWKSLETSSVTGWEWIWSGGCTQQQRVTGPSCAGISMKSSQSVREGEEVPRPLIRLARVSGTVKQGRIGVS